MALRLRDPFCSPWDVMDRRMAEVANEVFRGLDGGEGGVGGWGMVGVPRFPPSINQGMAIKNDSDKFQVDLDVSHFTPEQLKVKVVEDHLVIEGKHHEESEHGYESREFFRRVPLPDGVSPDKVVSSLKGGKLVIQAPKKAIEDSKQRQVPIQVHKD